MKSLENARHRELHFLSSCVEFRHACRPRSPGRAHAFCASPRAAERWDWRKNRSCPLQLELVFRDRVANAENAPDLKTRIFKLDLFTSPLGIGRRGRLVRGRQRLQEFPMPPS